MATYSDLNLNFFANPNTKDVAKRFDLDAVKTAVKNLLFTNKGEKLFQPRFGGNLNGLMFEQITPDIIPVLKRQWMDLFEMYEPRIILNQLDVHAEDNQIVIILNISMRDNTDVSFNLPISVNKIR